MHIRFPVQARPGLRLVAYASKSATGRDYVFAYSIDVVFYHHIFPSRVWARGSTFRVEG
jgi:hypothetical protein